MVPILIRMKFSPPPDVSKRRLKEITREAHRVQALEWHRQFIRFHFNGAARYRYGYKQRRPKYLKKKQRIAGVAPGKVLEGGSVDLVYSGLTREAMLRPPLVRAFPNRARLEMAGPSYVAMRPKRPNKPNLGAEITAVTPDEVRTLEKVLNSKLTDGLNAVQGSLTVNCGSH